MNVEPLVVTKVPNKVGALDECEMRLVAAEVIVKSLAIRP